MLPANSDELVIEPTSGFRHYWRDIWRYRELFYILAWRDIAVRYKQTVIGIVWALIRPFLTMVIFVVVFNKVAKLEAPGSVPYPLMVFAAMLPWQFFSTALSESSNSLISNANLISKVYFPRMIVPAGSVITSFVDFLITCGLMALLMVWYGFLPDWRVLTVPLFIALAFGAAFGAGLWLCALNVKYRDFRYIVPFFVQFGLYVSPVGFGSNLVPEQWRLLYSLNPMVGVIDGFRWALLRGESALWWPSILTSVALASVLCLSGVWYFRHTERAFARRYLTGAALRAKNEGKKAAVYSCSYRESASNSTLRAPCFQDLYSSLARKAINASELFKKYSCMMPTLKVVADRG